MMNNTLSNDLSQLDDLLGKVKQQGIDFIQQLPKRQTSTQNRVNLASKLSETGLGASETLKHFNEKFEPILVASAGPRYWGFVTGGVTPAAILGDWLTTIYDQNTQTTKGHGDISACIELETIHLLLDMFNLPNDFLGGFVTGATLSNFTCLAVARQWVGQCLGKDFAKNGLSEKLNILAGTPHSSSIKSLSMLGIGSGNILKIKTLSDNREAMDMDDLEAQIKHLNGEPFILISSGGTVNTVDFDDFIAIKKLKTKYHFWWHIDAAFGGFAACSNQYKHLVEGWDTADSITIDCHKWLNVPYESAVFFVKEKHQHLQVETFQNSNAPYLGNVLENFSYLNFLPENSRRMRALPTWFSLIAYGKKGYADIVENSISLAQQFGNFITQDPHFELLAPVRLNTVCFTLSGNKNKVGDFLTELNNTQQVFMTPTLYNGQTGIRAAFVNWQTSTKDVALVIKLMKEVIHKLTST